MSDKWEMFDDSDISFLRWVSKQIRQMKGPNGKMVRIDAARLNTIADKIVKSKSDDYTNYTKRTIKDSAVEGTITKEMARDAAFMRRILRNAPTVCQESENHFTVGERKPVGDKIVSSWERPKHELTTEELRSIIKHASIILSGIEWMDSQADESIDAALEILDISGGEDGSN